MEIKNPRQFTQGMLSLMGSMVLFLFADALMPLLGGWLPYLLGLGLLVGGTWLVERATGGSWRGG